MLRKLMKLTITVARNLLKLTVQGHVFRLYTWPGPTPRKGAHLRIAICHLIPNLGDAVMVFPLLDAIRKENPEAEIACFTTGSASILGLHPAVDQIYVWKRELSWRHKIGLAAYIYDIWLWWRRELRNLEFDSCVVLRGGVDPFHSAHLAWLLAARDRVGYSSTLEPERMEMDLHKSSLLTKQVERLNGIHEVSRSAEVLMLAGLIREQINLNQPVSSMLQLAHSHEGQTFVAGLPELRRPYVIVAPGSSTPRRQWPSERFAEFTEQEILPRGWLPVFVGGPEDAAACAGIAASLGGPSLNLAGRTNFQQLAAVCAGAEGFVGNDSGTGHMAGACGVPTLIVAAFASTRVNSHHSSTDRSRPVGPFTAVVKPSKQMLPCMEECLADEPHCILQVEVEDMRKAFATLLDQRSGIKTKLSQPAAS